MQFKHLIALCGASCVALLGVQPLRAAESNEALERKIEILERALKDLSTQVKANNAATRRVQRDAAVHVEKVGPPMQIGTAYPVVVPPNATLLDKKSQMAPNIIFEPLQPGMSLINDPYTWLGIYGTAEADIVSQSHANAKGETRHGFDAAPWMSANRFGITGAHTFDKEHGIDVIVRLEAEYQLPTGNQDTPGVLFNRDAWIGVQSDDWGKLTAGRQNSLGRDATQFWGDPYGTHMANLTEGGYINQTNTQAIKEYVGSPTGSRVDSGIVWKKLTGNLYTAAMYQFGNPQGQSSSELNPGNFGPDGVGSQFGKFHQGSSQAVAAAYDFGVVSVGGFYEHANINSFTHQVGGIGANVIVNEYLRLNGGYLRYTAEQEFGGRRHDDIFTAGGIFMPTAKIDVAVAYNWMNAHNALQDSNGFTLAPYSDNSILPNLDGNGNNNVSSGIRQTVYGSVRYKFDPFTLVFVGVAYTRLTDGFHYSEAHGYNDILDIGTGFRYLF